MGRLNLLDYYKIIGLKAKYFECPIVLLRKQYKAEKNYPGLLEKAIISHMINGRDAEVAMGVSLAAEENLAEHTLRTFFDITEQIFFN